MLEKKEVKELILNTIKDDDIEINDINDNTVLVGEDGIFFDSVDVLELIVELENKYGIKIKDNHIVEDKFRTFKSLYEFITKYKK